MLLAAMKVLSWNPRGLGNPRDIRNLHELITKEDPDAVFMQETKVRASYFSSLKFLFEFHYCFAVDWVGLGKCLVVLWKKGG